MSLTRPEWALALITAAIVVFAVTAAVSGPFTLPYSVTAAAGALAWVVVIRSAALRHLGGYWYGQYLRVYGDSCREGDPDAR